MIKLFEMFNKNSNKIENKAEEVLVYLKGEFFKVKNFFKKMREKINQDIYEQLMH